MRGRFFISSVEMIQYREESSGVISAQLYEGAECHKIVEQIRRLPHWTAALVRDAKDVLNYELLNRPDIRSAQALISTQSADIYEQFEARVETTLCPLIKQYWQLGLSSHSGTHLLRYGPADHYVPHQDIGPGLEDRYFSIVCYLNDDFEGGQTSFPGLGYSATPVSGKAIIFPSHYLHCSEPVTRGEKFVIVSWIIGPAPVKWI